MQDKKQDALEFNTSTRESKQEKKHFSRELLIMNPCCAGLDMHKETIWVCRSADLGAAKPEVTTFGTSTPELKRLAKFLESSGVTTVAMESTGVYWLPAYMLLRDSGLSPVLINPGDPKRISGRPKTDREDCIWICRLHQYGFLRASFIPEDRVHSLRELLRARERYIEQTSRLTQQMIGELVKMNIRLDVILSDITGASGRAVLDAILDNGDRSPEKLYSLLNVQIRNKMPQEQILSWLDGKFDDIGLKILRLQREDHRQQTEHLKEVNREIVKVLKSFPRKGNLADLPPEPKNYREDSLCFDEPLRPVFFEIFGKDLTQLPGIGANLLLSFVAVAGTDLSAWKDARHFTSWLGLTPVANVSAGFSKPARTKKSGNILTNAFKVAAMTAKRTGTAIGRSARVLAARILPKKARTAVARKLAALVFNILKFDMKVYVWTEEEYERKSEAKKKTRTFEKLARLLSDAAGMEEFRKYLEERNLGKGDASTPVCI